ncbi:MAG: type II toxin-antitoxin system CcdA family antitoxin [Candidatus Latescibacterota bacterium]
MHSTKTSVTIPDDVLQEARQVTTNLSALVTEALREHLRQRKVQRAMASFGGWEERPETSVDLVNSQRSDEGRDYAGRSD